MVGTKNCRISLTGRQNCLWDDCVFALRTDHMTDRSFGQRRDPNGSATGAIRAVRESKRAHSPEHYGEQPMLPSATPKLPLVDDDLREWKHARKPNFHTLWRPLLLMATLCFGIASLVLPDSVNDAVDWLLYAMTGVSLYSWIRSRPRANT
jgi:hypothetical protein